MRRSGFTLIEVLVALTLAALVVLLAHRVFTAALDGSHRLLEARTRLDRQSNARRWLVDAFGSLAVGPVGGPFDGRPSRVTFGTWLTPPSGSFAPARVTLGADGPRLMARWEGGDSLMLADRVLSATFDYLLEPGADVHWGNEWTSPVSAPVAVRLRVTRQETAQGPLSTDTVLLYVGPRG